MSSVCLHFEAPRRYIPMMIRVVGFIGASGSGKTTLICRLVNALPHHRITVIKHTHHHISSHDNRGDTLAFLQAGATRAILAAPGGEAMLWRSDGSFSRSQWSSASEIVEQCDGDLIFIEGFRSEGTWPLVSLDSAANLASRVVAVVSDAPQSVGDIVTFRRDEVRELADFLDTIAAS
jgi:molybdopterin-guanine dinucleotide biosynthesis protein MobB